MLNSNGMCTNVNHRTLPETSQTFGAATVSDTATPTAALQANSLPAPELEESTIDDLQRDLESGKETARSLVDKYLARIDAMNHCGVSLRAVLETNPEALAIADALDRERAAHGPRGPLHGIPILLKDNIDTADMMPTTAGSLALEGSIASKDATVAARLRDAGAILLGKTNMSEWANFRSRRASSGWSSRGGQCRNPYALDRTPSGSSSGSGAAAAANLAAATIGTETDGSIVSPSAVASLVGIKPTLGLISRAGIIPIASSQDTAGPMARTVRDAAILLGAMIGADKRDPLSKLGVRNGKADYTNFLVDDSLQGLRLGVIRQGIFGKNNTVDTVIETALTHLERLGAEIVDHADIANIDDVWLSGREVLLFEFKSTLNAYLSNLGPHARVRSLEALIAWNEAHREEVMPFFGQELFVDAQSKEDLTSEAYQKLLEQCQRLARIEGLDTTMNVKRVDALVTATEVVPWLIDLAKGESMTFGASCAPAIAGYPHITVPAGHAHGLPVGISFIGRAWSEPLLLRIAYAYEQLTKHRKAPLYLPTTDQVAPH